MVSIIKVPGISFQQRGVLNINNCEPAENDNPPLSPEQGGLQGSIGQVFDCTAFSAGPAPTEDVPDAGEYDYFPDAEDLPDTIEVDVTGDGEADLEVTDIADIPEDGVIVEDGDTPEVDEDGDTVPDGDADVVEDGEVSGPCDNAPFVDPIPAYPSIGEINVPLDPTLILNGADAVDVDPGDRIVSYNFIVSINPDLSSPVINVTDLSASEYPVPAGALADATTYYWAMEAVDTCGRVTRSAIWNFTTLNTCAAYPSVDTDFTAGTLSGVVASLGSLRLAQDGTAWSYGYEGDVSPADVGWELVNGAGSDTPLGGELIFNTMGSDGVRYYQRSGGFDPAVGSVVEIRPSIDDSDGGGYLYLLMRDGSRFLALNIYSDHIVESNSGMSYFFPLPGPGMHTYRVEFKGDDFRVYMDGDLTPVIDGTGRSLEPAGGINDLRFGDPTSSGDIAARIDYIRSYNLGDQLPYASPGSYESAPVDTGIIAIDHTGETMGWSPLSAAGTVTIAVRAADDLTALASAPWSAELTDNPATIPAGIVGRYLQWRVTLTAPDPTTTPVVDEVTVTRTCP
ncbi:MAG: hypothetical protein WC645_00045 [Candidatus Margulisiibacteriota bacterium]